MVFLATNLTDSDTPRITNSPGLVVQLFDSSVLTGPRRSPKMLAYLVRFASPPSIGGSNFAARLAAAKSLSRILRYEVLKVRTQRQGWCGVCWPEMIGCFSAFECQGFLPLEVLRYSGSPQTPRYNISNYTTGSCPKRFGEHGTKIIAEPKHHR